MRYWILATQASPAAGGGIGTYVEEMRAALTASGHEVLVLLASPDAGPLTFRNDPFPTVEFNPHAWTEGTLLRGWAAVALGASNALRFLVRAKGVPDFLECQDYGGLAYFVLQRQWALEPGYPRVRVGIRAHGPTFALQRFADESRYALPGYWFGEMERFALEAADPGLAVGELLAALAALPPRAARRFPVVRPRPQLPVAPQPDAAEAGLLTVVIPCFNLGDFVAESLASAAASSYRPLEILVVDDGSTDPATRAVLDGLSVPEEPGLTFRLVRTANQGLSRTRNHGAALARGEFLAFLDADDAVRPAYFARAVDVLRAYDNVGMVGCWLSSDGPNTEWITWNTEFPYLLVHNTVNSAGVVHRRDVFRSHGLNDPALVTGMEDADSVLRIAAAGWFGVALPSKLFHYRYRADSMVRQFNLTNLRVMTERIATRSAALLAEYAVDVIGIVNANGPGWAQADLTGPLVPLVVPVRSRFRDADQAHRELTREAFALRASEVLQEHPERAVLAP